MQAEIIPPRPIPPNGAAYVMSIPRLGADGVRQTVNSGLSADERAWNFRAAWNVAALNCLAPEYQPILDAEVTEEAVARYFAHRIEGKVSRWRLPGINGFNFLLRKALGGGGMASLKADPLAKAFAQMLLDMPVRVPAEMAKTLAA